MTETLPQPGPEAGFDEPWQLEAFSAVVALTRQGLFTWSQWVEVFSTVIADQPQRVDESVTQAYYRQWSSALETVLEQHAGLTRAEIERRHEGWHAAYLGTPHGQPVVLENQAMAQGCPPARHDDHHHDHDHPTMSRGELFVDPARR
jgi:nitrile hydratase accessory protein